MSFVKHNVPSPVYNVFHTLISLSGLFCWQFSFSFCEEESRQSQNLIEDRNFGIFWLEIVNISIVGAFYH